MSSLFEKSGPFVPEYDRRYLIVRKSAKMSADAVVVDEDTSLGLPKWMEDMMKPGVGPGSLTVPAENAIQHY